MDFMVRGRKQRSTLLRRKPCLRAVTHFGVQARGLSPWMNAMRVPLEAHEERNGVCFGGFRPSKHVEEPRAFARSSTSAFGRTTIESSTTLFFRPMGFDIPNFHLAQ